MSDFQNQERSFSIEDSAKAFEILSSNIYTDSILAVVRELSTNAFDAHVASNNESVPFDVHLPTYQELFFSIRDYGTGLCHDDVMKLYTTYFHSGRNGQPGYIGGKGLGSKSPFAYAEEYKVVSFFNGVCSKYRAFKTEDSIPAILLEESENTTEPNGLSITIQVEMSDVDHFKNAAKRIYEWFLIKPNCNIVGLYEDRAPRFYDNPKYQLIASKNYDGTYFLSGRSLEVIMGQVSYSVDFGKIECKEWFGRLVLFVPLNSCETAASREELKYNNDTLITISTALNAALADIEADLTAKINKSTNLFEGQIATFDANKVMPIFPAKGDFNSTTQEYFIRDLSLHGNRLRIWDLGRILVADFNRSAAFIEQDEEINSAARNRIKAYIGPTTNKWFIVTIKDMPTFEKTFGKPRIKLSQLPKAPKKIATQTNNRYGINFIKEWDLSGFWWKPVTNVTPGLFAANREGNLVIINGHSIEFEKLKSSLLRFNIGTVYGIATSQYDRLVKKYQLVSLEDTLKTRLQTLLSTLTDIELTKIYQSSAFDNIKFCDVEGVSEETEKMFAVQRSIPPITSYTLDFMCSLFNEKVRPYKDYNKIFFDKYPLLRICGNYAEPKDLRDYIEMIEAKSNVLQ